MRGRIYLKVQVSYSYGFGSPFLKLKSLLLVISCHKVGTRKSIAEKKTDKKAKQAKVFQEEHHSVDQENKCGSRKLWGKGYC